MKISVAMCTYNAMRFASDQLESIANQSRPPDELIICDDASTDDTREILERFAAAANFPVTVSVNQSNIGVMRNFEKAIALCNGDVIALSDWDDVWYPQKLETFERVFAEAEEVGAVFSDADVVDVTLNNCKRKFSESVGLDAEKRELIRAGKTFDILLAQTMVAGSTMAFRSRFRDLLLPFPAAGPLNHDGWMALLLSCVTRFIFVTQSLIKYREHEAQVIGIQPMSKLQSVLKAQKTDAAFYLEQAVQFEEALNRLQSTSHKLTDPRAVARLCEKIAHLNKRATLPVNRLSRISPVTKEVLNSHYHSFSRGWFSAVKDLLV